MTTNGVIETSSGILLRMGFCDFEHDGGLNPSTETFKSDVPFPCKVKGQIGQIKVTKWNGSKWVEVDQP